MPVVFNSCIYKQFRIFRSIFHLIDTICLAQLFFLDCIYKIHWLSYFDAVMLLLLLLQWR